VALYTKETDFPRKPISHAGHFRYSHDKFTVICNEMNSAFQTLIKDKETSNIFS
jgi:hypothetical protein